MAATIGAVSLTYLKRGADQPIPKLATVAEVDERAGLDGGGVRDIGKRSPAVVWSGFVDETSAANAKTKREALLALQGTIVSTVDIWGATETNVLVEQVAAPSQHVVMVDAATKYRVRVSVTLRKVAA